MKNILAGCLFFALTLTLIPDAAGDTGDCGTHCDPVWNAINGCYTTGATATQLSQCICKADTSWDSDITPCVLCMSTYGSASQMDTLLQYQTQINCGGSTNTSSNGGDIYLCDSTCGSVWKVGNSCGDTNVACVCKNQATWQPWIQSCVSCCEQQGNQTLADRLRAWESFDCASATAPAPVPSVINGGGGGDSSGGSSGSGGSSSSKDDASLVAGLSLSLVFGTGLLWAVMV